MGSRGVLWKIDHGRGEERDSGVGRIDIRWILDCIVEVADGLKLCTVQYCVVPWSG